MSTERELSKQLSDARWKLNRCIDALRWYAHLDRTAQELAQDDGIRAREALEDVNDNKN